MRGKSIDEISLGDKAEVEVNSEKNRVKLRTCCYNQEGKKVIDGVATAIPPKK